MLSTGGGGGHNAIGARANGVKPSWGGRHADKLSIEQIKALCPLPAPELTPLLQGNLIYKIFHSRYTILVYVNAIFDFACNIALAFTTNTQCVSRSFCFWSCQKRKIREKLIG